MGTTSPSRIQPLLTAGSALFLVVAFFGLHPLFAYLSIACGSYFAIRSSLEAALDRRIDVNILMLLAAAGAIVLNQPLEAAGLLFLFSLSNTLEALAMAKTKAAIEGLMKLRPNEALLVTPDGEANVPVTQLQLGDLVRVRPYENVPVDGELVSQSASVDESSITGESMPAEKANGSKLFCGTQNLQEMLLMKVTAVVGETTLDRVIELVRDAQEHKASGERVSSWFGSRYTVFVVICFLTSFFVRLILKFPLRDAAYEALVLLVALSPCALVISTPASTLSALAWAARNGILFRGGAYIEAIGQVNIAAFDKTGTLTAGRPALREVWVWEEGSEPADGGRRGIAAISTGPLRLIGGWKLGEPLIAGVANLIAAASSAEQYSSHPVAVSIVESAGELGISVPEATEQRDRPGLGVWARVEGQGVFAGQLKMFESEGIEIKEPIRQKILELQNRGATAVIVKAGRTFGALAVTDAARPEAVPVIQGLRDLGTNRVVMLTGDNEATAAAVAKELTVDEFHAALLPDQKTAFVNALALEGTVMMVGDGVNDAPSLAGAHVGVAMGGVGSDITLNAADVVLMQDSLSKILDSVRLGRRTVRVITANLVFAGAVIVTLTASSLLLKLPLWMAVCGHEGSTVLVLLNGLRLLSGPGRTS